MEKITIIAEAGINHGGDVKVAHDMIDAAVEAGADVVKFQTVNPDLVYPDTSGELYKIFKKVQLKKEDWITLKAHAERVGIEFLSTPGDRESADLLEEIGVNAFKIASDSGRDVEFVKHVMDKNKPMIISTGHMTSVEDTIETMDKYTRYPEIIMHCVSKYPCPDADAALYKIPELIAATKDKSTVIGYSDHTVGISTAVSAVMLGARVLEKHFMIDKKAIDAPVSLMPDQLKELITKIRSLEK